MLAEHPSPIRRTPFLGRVRETGLLCEDLRSGARLITITGPSGMGKTRLATHVMQELAQDFEEEGGAWFCNLAGAASVADLEAAVARLLGAQRLLNEGLGRILARRGRMLLVLDNLDAIAAAASPILEDWLDRSEGLQLLCTSIMPLGSELETRFELGKLELEDAMRLYRNRVHSRWAAREADPDEGPVIEELVRRLDQMPLAIELAAARIHVFPPRVLLSRLSERFRLLQSGSGSRHGSLELAIRWTWELLDPVEQKALKRAAIFVGGFCLESAEAILGEGESPTATWELLDQLRGRSLLQLEEGDEPRYALYESIREFALVELAADADNGREARIRHAAHFLAKAEWHAAKLDGEDAAASLRWLATERENLLAAHRNTILSDPETAARIGLALCPLFTHLGPPSSELEFLDSVVAASRSNEALTIKALRARAEARIRHGAIEEANQDLDEAAARARAIGDEVEEAFILVGRFHNWVSLGIVDTLREGIERARLIAQTHRVPKLEGLASMRLGHAADILGDHHVAKRWFEEAHRIFRSHGFLHLQGIASMNLAVGWRRLGRSLEARRWQGEAKSIFRRLDDRATEAYLTFNQGGFELSSGQLEEAKRSTLEALRSDLGTGHLGFRALGLGNLGAIHILQDRLEEGEACLWDAVLCYEELSYNPSRAQLASILAAAILLRGRKAEARQCLDEARAELDGGGDRWSLAALEVLEGLFELVESRTTQDPAAARALRARAERRLKEAPTPPDGVGLVLSLAVQILRKALAQGSQGGEEPPAEAPAEGSSPIVIARDGSWFEVAGKQTNLQSRPTLRRLLVVLLEQHLREPGVGLEPDRLFERAWEGEKAQPSSASKRVYTGIWTLRSMGLPILLAGKREGYMLDADRSIEAEAEARAG